LSLDSETFWSTKKFNLYVFSVEMERFNDFSGFMKKKIQMKLGFESFLALSARGTKLIQL